ncbi:hypothetical protein AWV80_26080 [Cupriavidus sp. UYMU48A]|nr:hypothetical protein AWV80_26080 [Cupriavidus sp. UYMU48A]
MEIARTGDNSLLCFGTADMDFRSAPEIISLLASTVQRGHFGYPFKRASYYEAIIGFYARKFGWNIEKEWISSNVGIYPSMQPLIEELTDPGDEIIYQTPVHHIFKEVIEAAGRTAVQNPLMGRDGRYEMDFDNLAQVVTDRTRLFLLCSPHNPVGRVWTRGELLRLHEFCHSRGIVVLADEVYCGLLYPSVEFTPMAALSEEASLNTVTLFSASKSFNVTGLKHSLVITESKKLREAYLNGLKRNNLYYGGCIFGQAATEAALRDGDQWADAVMDYVSDNHRLLTQFLNDHIPEARVYQAEATYFAWVDLSALRMSTEQLQYFFERNAHIIVTHGAALGTGGEGHVRINLGCPRTVLTCGLHRIAAAYRHLQESAA